MGTSLWPSESTMKPSRFSCSCTSGGKCSDFLPASFSLPPDHTQTFVDCLLSAWLCAEHSGGYRAQWGYRAQRHHLGPQGTHQWSSDEWTVPHQRLLRSAQGMFQIIRVEGGRALWVLAWDLESKLRSKSGFQKHFLVVTLGPSHSLSEPQFAHL